MKKTIGFIFALIAFLTSCTNDDVIRQSENNQSVTISAAVDISFEGEKQALSSKSRAGSSYRYIMEVYSDENYTTMVGEQETSEDGNFTLTLDRTKEYYLLLWADANGESVYSTDNLKCVTVKDGEQALEAFSGKSTIEGNNSKISVSLKRCVGELRLMETGNIPAGSITVKFNEPKSFDVSTGNIGDATRPCTQKVIFEEDKKGTTASPVQLNSNSIYILSNADPSDIDFTIQYTDGSEGSTPEDAINVIGSIKANRRTNIKGHYTSAVAKIKEFTASDYYQWDAVDPVNGTSSGFGTGLSAATALFKSCPTYGDLLNYINAKDSGLPAVYWDNGDPGAGQQTYKAYNDEGVLKEYNTGIWLKKKSAIGTAWTNGLTPESHKYYDEEVIPQVVTKDIRTSVDYFFLPAAGSYSSDGFHNADAIGSYWLSTPYAVDSYYAYYLFFSSRGVLVNFISRNNGLVPLSVE